MAVRRQTPWRRRKEKSPDSIEAAELNVQRMAARNDGKLKQSLCNFLRQTSS